MTNTMIKKYQKFNAPLSKEDYELWQKWRVSKTQPRQFLLRKQMEKQLRHKGYGHYLGDLPKKNEITKEEYMMILRYRKLRLKKDDESAKIIRSSLRKIGLGAFTGDPPAVIKPPLKDRYFTPDAMISFANAINADVLGALDIEFTSIKHEVISLGCVLYDQKTNQTYSFYDTCKPVYEKRLSQRCMDLTHLTQDEINHSKDFSEVILEFLNFLNEHKGSYLMVWGNSDLPSLKTSFNFSRLSFKIRDQILEKVVDVQPIISLTRDEKRAQFSLQDMKDYFQLPGAVEHHALQDAIDLKDIVLSFKESYQPKDANE